LEYDEIALISLRITPSSNPSKEQLEDALDEAVYEESNYFLKRDFLPKLADKRILKLKPLCVLSRQLGIEGGEVENNVDPTDPFTDKDFAQIIGVYNERVSKFKLEITRTNSPCDIILIYEKWKQVFIAFCRAYCHDYEQKVKPEHGAQKVRISNIDFVELGEELKSGNFTSKARELYLVLKAQI
jgi:hypothetical protein